MRDNFEKIKQAICTTCELYIPSPEGEYAIHVDACTYGIGAVLEQKTPDGKWVPCAFFSRKLEGKPGQGQRGWSVREQETYAIVSCLLKFKSWISGRKVTFFSDHKSLESWYKEDLCTVSGPLGRRGRWHEFLSRYNIVVVYKPGPDNQVADGLSRWAYPAGLAEDSTFHGSESDLEGVQRQERELLERGEQFLAHQSDTEPRASVAQVVRQFRTDRLLYLNFLYMRALWALMHAFLSFSAILLATVAASSMFLRSAPLECAPSSPELGVCRVAASSLPPFSDFNEVSEDEGSAGPSDEDIESLLTLGVDDGLQFTDEGQEVYKSSVRPRVVCRIQARLQLRKQLLRQDYSRGAHALIAGLTKVKIPPAVKILYEDWESHYRADSRFSDSGVLEDAIANTVAHGFVWSMGKLRKDQRIVVPVKILDQVIVAVHSYSHPGFRKTVEVFNRKFVCLDPKFSRAAALDSHIKGLVASCHICSATKARRGRHPDTCHSAPIPHYPFASVSMDFFSLPRCKHEATGEIFDYVYVIVCRLTGYILAIPCQQKGLDTRKAAQLFLDRCVFFMGMPQSIYSDNQSIISNDFISTLCELAGAEYHKTVPYRPQSNGRAERAVQSVICSLRQCLEQRGKGKHNNWVTSLPLALWGLNDLPGAVHPYSPHRLVFGREPIGWGDCPPYVDEEGCEDAGAFFRRLVQERDAIRDKLHAIHEREYRKFLKAHPPQFFRPGDKVWVRNRVDSPPVYPKLDRLWQGPAEVLARLSESTYRVNYNGLEQVLPVDRLKSYVPYRDGTRAPLHYFSEREGLVESEDYIVDRVLKHETRGSGANRKLWWYVKYRGYPQPEWQPATSFLHDIQEEWLKYNKRHRLDLKLSDLK